MANRNTGLASPPLTPPHNPDLTYKNKSSEMNVKPRKEKLNRYTKNRVSYASTSSLSSAGTRSLMNNRKSITIPDLQRFNIPESMMPVGPNGERIPIMIPDGNGGLIPFTNIKKSKKKNKSKSNNSINPLSPALSESIFKIDEDKVTSNPSSPESTKRREKKSSPKKASKRQSLLIPLSTNSLSPTSSTSTSTSGELSTGLSNKNLPMFIIPTGPDGKIDPSTLPTPMSSTELMERQREYEESILEDNLSITSSKKHGKAMSEAGRKKSKSKNVARNLSYNSMNIKKSDSLFDDGSSEFSSSNFSLRNLESNNSSTSFYNEPESDVNVNEAFETLSPEKKDSAISLKKKIDEAVEATRTIKDSDLKYENFLYVVNNIQLLPIALHETYRKNVMKIMKKAVQTSQHGESLLLLGNLYTSGLPGITTVELKHFRPNYNKAYNYFFQGYKNNHQECSFNVAVCHELGLGTKVDKRKAYQIYQKAATLNHPGAMCRLGLACLNGELNMKTNLKEGVRWLRLSTMYANKDYPQAFYHLSTIYERGIPNLVIRDYKYAIQLLDKAAVLGHIPSQHKLGICYEYGKMGVEVDAKTSMRYFGMAAAKGHGESMFELAGWYLTGSEVYKDESRQEVEYVIEPSNEIAFQWTRKAAERNLPKAEFAIGYFYDNGIGINKDPEEAMKWYYVASTHKDPKAIQKMSEKSSQFWLNQIKASELPSIENEIYSRICNYDLIEDELNLHFTTESIHESVLNCETIKSNDNNSNSNTNSPKGSRTNTPTSSKSDKCTIM